MKDKSELISRLKRDDKFRISYIRAKLNVNLPAQIRALRKNQNMTQALLAEEADMKQSRISAMERPGAVGFNMDTLIRLAAALKVALVVKFIPFSELLKWENEFSQDTFKVIDIDKDFAFSAPQRLPVEGSAEVAKAKGAGPSAEMASVLSVESELTKVLTGGELATKGENLGSLLKHRETPGSRQMVQQDLTKNLWGIPPREKEGAMQWNYSTSLKQDQYGCLTSTT